VWDDKPHIICIQEEMHQRN